jgi:hypothetical protein
MQGNFTEHKKVPCKNIHLAFSLTSIMGLGYEILYVMCQLQEQMIYIKK